MLEFELNLWDSKSHTQNCLPVSPLILISLSRYPFNIYVLLNILDVRIYLFIYLEEGLNAAMSLLLSYNCHKINCTYFKCTR